MVIEVKANTIGLDSEWMRLILEAKRLGIELEEIREFLNNNSIEQNNHSEAL